jgi:hypothetical protein
VSVWPQLSFPTGQHVRHVATGRRYIVITCAARKIMGRDPITGEMRWIPFDEASRTFGSVEERDA